MGTSLESTFVNVVKLQVLIKDEIVQDYPGGPYIQ